MNTTLFGVHISVWQEDEEILYSESKGKYKGLGSFCFYIIVNNDRLTDSVKNVTAAIENQAKEQKDGIFGLFYVKVAKGLLSSLTL